MTTTLRQKYDEILNKHFFEKYNIPKTYGASDELIYKVTQTIDELSAQSQKGFCLRTANRIKNKINESGESVSPEPKN